MSGMSDVRRITVLFAACALLIGFTHSAFAGSLAKTDECNSIQSGQAEVVTFQVPTRTDHPAEVQAVYRSAITEDAPLVVVLHTSRGLDAPDCYSWLQEAFAEANLSSLVVDTLSGWEAENGRSAEIGIYTMIADLQSIAAQLRDHFDPMPKALGVAGFSVGGRAVLTTFYDEWAYDDPAQIPFAAAVSVYATCPISSRPGGPPLLLVHGTGDQVAPIESCRAYFQGRSAENTEMLELEAARHLFDHPSNIYFDEQAAKLTVTRVVEFFAQRL